MNRLYIRPIRQLNAGEQRQTMEFLDACAGACAYQYPYLDGSSDILVQVERDGQLCFSGRASIGVAATRFFPFLKVMTFNRGPVAATGADLIDGMTRAAVWARDERFLKVTMMPDLAPLQGKVLIEGLDSEFTVIESTRQRFSLRMDITAEEDSLLAALPGSCRYKIRRAEREGIRVIQGTTEAHLEAFLAAYKDMTRRKELVATSPDFFRSLWQLRSLDSSRIGLLVASHNNDVLGANLVFRSGKRAEYLFGAVYRDKTQMHGHVAAGYPLQWSGIQWARAGGCDQYDFGGFSPGMESGPARMKRAFFQTAIPTELMPASEIDLRPQINRCINRIRRIFSRRSARV